MLTSPDNTLLKLTSLLNEADKTLTVIDNALREADKALVVTDNADIVAERAEVALLAFASATESSLEVAASAAILFTEVTATETVLRVADKAETVTDKELREALSTLTVFDNAEIKLLKALSAETLSITSTLREADTALTASDKVASSALVVASAATILAALAIETAFAATTETTDKP